MPTAAAAADTNKNVRAKKTTFFQSPPHLGNQYLEDTTLQEILQQKIFTRADIDEGTKLSIRRDLERFGDRVMGDVWQWAIEAEEHPPSVRHFDAWQRRIDRIETCRGWQMLVNDVSPQEGIVALGYDAKMRQKNIARLYQFTKLYLFNPSSAVATCPLAMTDGAARLIEEIGTPFLKEQVLPHLLSRDPQTFWTSGQWMTEKPGGSDVSRTETVARHSHDDEYLLDGFKWFTSATDCQVTFGLARIVDENGHRDASLSLFFIELRDEDGNLNGIKIHKLKDKLGTKALPTAELSLRNTRAKLVGTRGRGVASISYMLNITRTYNSVCAVSYMRRAVALSRDYASRRMAFGASLDKQPMHVHTMASMEVETSASLIAVMHMAELLNKEESQTATEQESSILRLMTPVYKMYTGKKSVELTSEGIESIGGGGYLEDTHIPAMLRNAQVLPIWEGTSNVMSLDVQRVLLKHPDALIHVDQHISHILSETAKSFGKHRESLERAKLAISDSWKQLMNYVQTLRSEVRDQRLFQAEGRELAFSLAHCYTTALLLDHYLGNKRIGASSQTLDRNIAVIDLYIEDHAPLCVLRSTGKPNALLHILQRGDLLGNDRAAFFRTPEHLRARY